MKAKVVKDRSFGGIRRFASLEEIGAEMELDEFIRRVCLRYGNPATTLTVSGLTAGMLEAMGAEVQAMKDATAVVA